MNGRVKRKNYGTCTHATHLKINMKMAGLRCTCTVAKRSSHCELMPTEIVREYILTIFLSFV